MMKKSNILIFLAILFAIVTAFTLGVNLAPNFAASQSPQNTALKTVAETYTCPMHNHIHAPNEGVCPICGMDLVRQHLPERPAVTAGRAEVLINPATAHNFGIKTTPVIRDTIHKDITIYGYISQINANKPLPLTTKVTGTIKTFNDGKPYYAQGETIYTLESEAYLQAQKDYIAALDANDVAKMRQLGRILRKMDFNQQALKQLAQNRQPSRYYHFRAAHSGALNRSSDGSNLTIGQTLAAGAHIGELIPRYPISAYAKVFESQWMWLKASQDVSLKIRQYPGQYWQGIVKSVDDLAQSSTTAVKLTADFEDNNKVKLRLGMQVEMTVATQSQAQALLVPRSAVIQTGSKTVVVVAKGNGYYQPVDVQLGLSNHSHSQILRGLVEGLEVVVSGQFLLDSQSEINAGIKRLSSSEPLAEPLAEGQP